jgi:hypothetical protein
MALWQRVLTVVALVVVIILGLAFLAFTGQLFVWLGPVAEKWEHAPLAYVALGLCVFVVSFPPLVGWSTLGTISGFMFGFWKGWVHPRSERDEIHRVDADPCIGGSSTPLRRSWARHAPLSCPVRFFPSSSND